MANIVVPAGTPFVRGIAVGELGVYAKGGAAPPPYIPTNARFIESGDPRLLENGDPRFIESGDPRFIESGDPRFIESGDFRILEA